MSDEPATPSACRRAAASSPASEASSEAASFARGTLDGDVEHTRVPRVPLDVLCQQIVAMASVEELQVDELHALVRRAYPYRELTREQLENVLDLLAGRYPSDEFAELRPRIVWERTTGALRAREGAQRVAIANAGTIPTVASTASSWPTAAAASASSTRRWCTRRAKARSSAGASAWRIEQIARDRVLVSPAPGQPAQVPFGAASRPVARWSSVAPWAAFNASLRRWTMQALCSA